jgi:hypothetical protein
MIGLSVAFFLCLGLVIYLAIILGKALNTARRDKSTSSKQNTKEGL